MTNDTPKDRHQLPYDHPPLPQQQLHQTQKPLPEDFKQKLEALYNQCRSWFDHHKQDLDILEKHQHDINKAQLESVATVKANLQLTRSDVAFLRSNIRTQDDRIEELRSLIDKTRQLSAAQTETIIHLKQERVSLIASQTSLQQRADRFQAELTVMTLRLETLERQLSRLKKEFREHNEVHSRTQRNNSTITATTVNAEKVEQNRRAQEIQRILATIHGFEAVHAHALESLPSRSPSSDTPQDQGQVREKTATKPSYAASPLPQTHLTVYVVGNKPRVSPTSTPSATSSSSASNSTSTTSPSPSFIDTTFNPISPPPPLSNFSPTATSMTPTTAATTTNPASDEASYAISDTEIPHLQLPHPHQPLSATSPRSSQEKLQRLQRAELQVQGEYDTWLKHQQSLLLLSHQFSQQEQCQEQQLTQQLRQGTLPHHSSNPFVIPSPQYINALASFAFSFSLSALAFITIQIYGFFLQSDQHQSVDFSSVCENTYPSHHIMAVPIEKDFIPT